MTEYQKQLIAATEAFVADNGLEVELSVVRELIANGTPLARVSFMMRDRYSREVLMALSAEAVKKQQSFAVALPTIS